MGWDLGRVLSATTVRFWPKAACCSAQQCQFVEFLLRAWSLEMLKQFVEKDSFAALQNTYIIPYIESADHTKRSLLSRRKSADFSLVSRSKYRKSATH